MDYFKGNRRDRIAPFLQIFYKSIGPDKQDGPFCLAIAKEIKNLIDYMIWLGKIESVESALQREDPSQLVLISERPKVNFAMLEQAGLIRTYQGMMTDVELTKYGDECIKNIDYELVSKCKQWAN